MLGCRPAIGAGARRLAFRHGHGRSRTIWRITTALLAAALLAACETAAPAAPDPGPTSIGSVTPSPSPSAPAEVAVAFLQDLSAEGAAERIQPAFQAIELAFSTAALVPDAGPVVDLVPFDTAGTSEGGDGAAAEIAGDPRFVAAIAAPQLPGQAELAADLAAAGVSLLSLSARATVDGAPSGTWFRFVAPVRDQAVALAEAASSIGAARKGICVVAGPADGTVYARAVRRAVPLELTVIEVANAGDALAAGCGVVLLTGGAEEAAGLARGLAGDDEGAPLIVGGPGLREPAFIERAGSAAEGAVSVCSCADVATSLDLAAQRFIQDYQFEFGSSPGSYAVEAWDAAHVLVRAFREGVRSRADLVSALVGLEALDGLGGRYVFEDGELAAPGSAIRRYRVEGGRWVAVEPG
jgi:ABC-type branched-subunit amino acid transport system substrate-binding protein